MLVLADEMFDSPPVFAWVLPVFVRLKPGKEETFSSVSRSRIFCCLHLVHFRDVVWKGQGKPGGGEGKGKGKG